MSSLIIIDTLRRARLGCYEIPDGIHGQSLSPPIRDEKVAIRKYGCYNKFGEAISVTDGRWTLFQWPSGERIMPLHWYSSQPPQFLIPNAIGPNPPAPLLAGEGPGRGFRICQVKRSYYHTLFGVH